MTQFSSHFGSSRDLRPWCEHSNPSFFFKNINSMKSSEMLTRTCYLGIFKSFDEAKNCQKCHFGALYAPRPFWVLLFLYGHHSSSRSDVRHPTPWCNFTRLVVTATYCFCRYGSQFRMKSVSTFKKSHLWFHLYARKGEHQNRTHALHNRHTLFLQVKTT